MSLESGDFPLVAEDGEKQQKEDEEDAQADADKEADVELRGAFGGLGEVSHFSKVLFGRLLWKKMNKYVCKLIH